MPRRSAAALAAAGVLLLAWWQLRPTEERMIDRRLASLAAELNAGASGGVEAVARAVAFGGYFAEDVVIDMGEGTSPIAGRDTVVAMATRIEPRIRTFTVALEDVQVHVSADGTRADVVLTVTFSPGAPAQDEPSIDAREFAVEMQKAGGEWVVARASVVKTLR